MASKSALQETFDNSEAVENLISKDKRILQYLIENSTAGKINMSRQDLVNIICRDMKSRRVIHVRCHLKRLTDEDLINYDH